MQNSGLWAGLVILLYAITIFYQSLSLDYSSRLGPGPGFFPRWLSGILIVLTIFYLLDSLKNNVVSLRKLLPEGRALNNMAAMLGGLVVFTLIVNYTGFVIAGSVLLFSMFIREYRWYYAVGSSVALSIILFVLFQSLLGVSLPTNDFGW
ncbi:MAG: tripartite tricarboxylate transporter TctB family protein [Sporomusaceae bacterium]|nr:tripartite tricarboxylate transporter TctB family protein [Sporomusaceae bacterium]